MRIDLEKVELRKVDVVTRMPFRYGIATVTALPHLLVFADFVVDDKRVQGVAADMLPPKWFTKRPNVAIEDEIAEMLKVIRSACASAQQLGERENVFRWWQDLYQQQQNDSSLVQFPSLLKNFGVSLLERAAIDATCRRQEVTFHNAILLNLLGIRLEEIHPELANFNPVTFLPKQPTSSMSIRHTVGLSDPLEDADIEDSNRLSDGLPQSLQANLQYYGIRYLKIKIPANIEDARSRIKGIANLFGRNNVSLSFTLDGNEFFEDPDQFRSFWDELNQDRVVKECLREGLLLVEQPLRRDIALTDEASRVFNGWNERPPIIIDESDGELDSLRRALATGYVGTSHKNCKGIIKGIANACFLKFLNSQDGGNSFVCTGEDLMNMGPVALLQDFAVAAALGLTHVERNGHHYMTGLQPMPSEVQQSVLDHHSDLYVELTSHGMQFPTLAINQGQVNLNTVNQAPFGYASELTPQQFEVFES